MLCNSSVFAHHSAEVMTDNLADTKLMSCSAVLVLDISTKSVKLVCANQCKYMLLKQQ